MKTLKRTTLSIVTLGLAVASPLGLAQSSSASPTTPHATTSAPRKATDAKPVEDLQAAAQRLRDAIHAMAQASTGLQRNQAIRDGNRALMEVNEAMANLPPDMLTAQADESKYKQSIDRLQQAAQRLRDATHALAADPYSTRRNEILRRVDPARVSADCPGFVAGIAWRHDVLSMFCSDPEPPPVSRRASTFFSSSLGARAGNRQFQMRLRYRLRYRSHCLSTLRPGLLQCRVRTFGQARRDAQSQGGARAQARSHPASHARRRTSV